MHELWAIIFLWLTEWKKPIGVGGEKKKKCEKCLYAFLILAHYELIKSKTIYILCMYIVGFDVKMRYYWTKLVLPSSIRIICVLWYPKHIRCILKYLERLKKRSCLKCWLSYIFMELKNIKDILSFEPKAAWNTALECFSQRALLSVKTSRLCFWLIS